MHWLDLKPFNANIDKALGEKLSDIMQHEAPGDSNHYDEGITQGHETTHGINAWIRNNMAPIGARINGFYVLQNRAIVLQEPNFRKSAVAEFVPASLRWSRFQMYIVGQTEWDDQPLYIFDEWTAYVNGGEVGVDQALNGLWKHGWQDGVAGCIEFNVYAIAVAMAVDRHDPGYWQREPRFYDFLHDQLGRSMYVYRRGAVLEQFKWAEQDDFYQKLKTSADASSMRDFIHAKLDPCLNLLTKE